jgi:UDP-glucose 4-epimerase
MNCGYGHGYSVREVLETVGRINGEALNITEEPRRAGDPPELIAGTEKIHQILGWMPKYDDLDVIVQTSLEWERKIAARDPSAYWPA